MKGTTMVYLALVVLVLMMIYAKSEGFEMPTYSGDRWLGLSNWYTNTPSTRDKPTTTITTGNIGTGVRKYETTTDTSNDLTSTEKSTAISALNKLIAQNESNEVLISCINKVKTKL